MRLHKQQIEFLYEEPLERVYSFNKNFLLKGKKNSIKRYSRLDIRALETAKTIVF